MYLLIKVLSERVREFYENHETYHEGDAGLDLFIPEDTLIKAHSTTIVNLQIACEGFKTKSPLSWRIEQNNYTPTSFYVYPRSSITKTPLRMANCVGIIDSGYRGPIMCALDNISDIEYVVKRGTRLVQICGPNLEPVTFKLKAELSSTTRGSGGFGSTGI